MFIFLKCYALSGDLDSENISWFEYVIQGLSAEEFRFMRMRR